MEKIPSAFERLTGNLSKKEGSIEFEGYKWLVGKISRNSIYPIDLQDLVKYYPLVVKSILDRIQDDSIAVSLPAETYFEDNLSGKRLINLISENIKKETGKSALVLPQGAIALQEIFTQGYLKPDKTLVIDGGFNTINIVIADETGDILYTRTYFNEFGIRDLLENYFKPELKVKYPEITSNLQKLKEIFLQEEIDVGLKIIDIKNEKNLALQSFIETLFSRILKDIERAGESFRQFTIIGGLSYYVPEIETNKPNFIPKENGEFFTGLGMKRYTGLTSIDFGFGDIKIV